MGDPGGLLQEGSEALALSGGRHELHSLDAAAAAMCHGNMLHATCIARVAKPWMTVGILGTGNRPTQFFGAWCNPALHHAKRLLVLFIVLIRYLKRLGAP